jgi:hypothetical protein
MADAQRMKPRTNPRWYYGFTVDDDTDWPDLRDYLANLMLRDSDSALAFRRSLLAHLNAVRHATLREIQALLDTDDDIREAINAKLQELEKEGSDA